MKDKDKAPLSLVVPDFFGDKDTAAVLEIFTEELGFDVVDSRHRRLLASGVALQPIQIAVYIIGQIGLGVLGSATWDMIKSIYKRLQDRFPKQPVSIEFLVEDDAGNSGEYWLHDGNDAALRAIEKDLQRDAKGPRVAYDVDQEGWLTWLEQQAKKHGRPKNSET